MKRLLALGALAGILAGCAAIPSDDYDRLYQSDDANGDLRSIDVNEHEYDSNWIDYGGPLPSIA